MLDRAPYRTRKGVALAVSGPTCLATLGIPGMSGPDEPISPARETESRDDLLVGFHGRLDNRSELLDSLGFDSGTRGAHGSDDAVIRRGYRRWGLALPTRLLGDFALVIWDPARRRLVAARDPMAMKPLYLWNDGDRTLVASEIRQIFAAGEVPRRLWEPAVCAHLGGGEIPTQRTFYDGVSQVSPGTMVVVEDGEERIERFSELLADLPPRPSERDIEQRFRESFRRSVRRRSSGASSVGVMLSGGLDSGSIASMLGLLEESGWIGSRIHTYSWAFPTLTQCDERDVSRMIVDRFGFAHSDLDAEEAHPLSGFPEDGLHEDDPLVFVYQPILQRTFEAAAGDDVDVLMSGDRGDLVNGDFVYDLVSELRGGHPLRAARGLTILNRRHGRGWTEGAWRYVGRPALSRIKSAWRWTSRSSHERNTRRNSARWPPWVNRDFVTRIPPPSPDPDPEGLLELDPARRRRARTVLANLHMRGMVVTERSHAEHGLDFADPWSDLELARLCIAADQNLLNHPGEEKRLVRAAMRGVIPEKARVACRKTIPQPLYLEALRTWEVDRVRGLIDRPRVHEMGYVNRDALADHFEAFLAGADLIPQFWWTLSLEMWLRRYW